MIKEYVEKIRTAIHLLEQADDELVATHGLLDIFKEMADLADEAIEVLE